MKKICIGVFLLLILTGVTFAQFGQQWVARYNGTYNSIDYGYAVAADPAGNVYVLGQAYNYDSTYGVKSQDFVLIKYNSAGVQQWWRWYNGPGHSSDSPSAIAVDASGNIYCAGYGYGVSGSYDIITLKYNTGGVLEWAKVYNGTGSGSDYGFDIALDASGNVYTAGYAYLTSSNNTSYDYIVLRYNSSGLGGVFATYDDPNHLTDCCFAMALDASGNVYLGGYGNYTSASYPDYIAVKFNSSGALLWAAYYNGPQAIYDYGRDIAVDGSGNVYMTGYSHYYNTSYYAWVTVKWNSSGGLIWALPFTGTAGTSYNQYGYYVKVTSAGDVYVAGNAYNINGSLMSQDMEVVKYKTGGTQQWARNYDPGYGDFDGVYAGRGNLAIDGAGNAYICGFSNNGSGYADYATVKYNAAGIQQWVMRYDNAASLPNDYAYWVAVDGSGNVYTTGRSYGLNNGVPSFDIATAKYGLIRDLGLSNASFSPTPPFTGQVATITDMVKNFGGYTASGFPISGRIWRTVLYYQGFEGTWPPAGWDVSEYSGSSAIQWKQVGTGCYPSRAPHSGSNQAYANCWSATANSWARLKTPALVLPGSPEVCRLSFWMYHDSNYPTKYYDSLYVEVSPSASGPWTVLPGGGIRRYSATPGWAKHTFSLAAYAGQTVYVAFRAFGYGPDISIDEITIQGTTVVWSADETWSGTIAAGAISSRPFTSTWTPSTAGNYVLETWTGLAGDVKPSNDTLYLNFLVSKPESADVYIQRNSLFLTGNFTGLGTNQVWCGAQYTPKDSVGNQGRSIANTITTKTFIDAWSFNGPPITSLAVDAKQEVSFNIWTASNTPGYVHNRRDTTYAASPTDPDLTNNKRASTYTAVYDGQAIIIDAPSDTVWTGTNYLLAAQVKNNSLAGVADFTATCTIEPGAYSSPSDITNLDFGVPSQVLFGSWTTPLTAGITYTMTVTCTPNTNPPDVNPENNTVTKSIFAYGDVGAFEPHYPLHEVYVNTNIYPVVRIRNFTGGSTEGFEVTCQVEDENGHIVYEEISPTEGLTPHQDQEVYFATAWHTPNEVGKHFTLHAFSRLPGDCKPANDQIDWEVVTVAKAGSDVRPKSIDSPANIIAGELYTPKATVENPGANPAGTFWTYCTVNAGLFKAAYIDSILVNNLAPDATRQLIFKDWTTEVGSSLLTVYTALAGDEHPENDTAILRLTATGIAESKEPVPTTYSLQASRPNPFYTTTEIRYSLPVTSRINLAVYDISGKLVKTLVNGTENLGFHRTVWNGVDASGKRQSSGLYFIRLETKNYTTTQKLIFITH